MALWNNTDAEASKPKYLNTADKAATLGVSVDEAQNAGNIAKGINTPGWVKYTTYTDAQGNTRNKAETLVAFSSLTGDNDTIDPDPVITIGTQPTNQSVTAPATATFTAAATATRGVAVSYQWQIQQEGTGSWANISGATGASYTTGATATGDGAGATDGDKYRVIVSAVGATPVTSNVATLTVTSAVVTYTAGTDYGNTTEFTGGELRIYSPTPAFTTVIQALAGTETVTYTSYGPTYTTVLTSPFTFNGTYWAASAVNTGGSYADTLSFS